MSISAIRKEFEVEADRLRRAVACGTMSAREAKSLMHKLAAVLIEEEVRLQKIQMVTSARWSATTEEL